jgi:hypothetical protein
VRPSDNSVAQNRPGRTPGSVQLHSPVTTLGQQLTEAEPEGLGVLRLTYRRRALSRDEARVYATLRAGILVGPVPIGYTQEVFQAWPRLRISGRR